MLTLSKRQNASARTAATEGGDRLVSGAHDKPARHTEPHGFIPGDEGEVHVPALKWLELDIINERATSRHTDSPVQWNGNVHFGPIGVNKGSPLTGQQPYFPAKPTDTRTGVVAA